MPIDASIPLSVKVPDSMTSLATIMGAARAGQQLQTGAIEQQQKRVDLEQQQGALDARKAVGQVMSDPSLRDPDTGMLDLNKLAPALQAADPKGYVWHDAFKKTAEVNSDMMKVKSLGMGLADQQQAFIGQRLGAVLGDPDSTPKDFNTALDDVVRVVPSAKTQADLIRKHVNGLDAETADKWRPVAMSFVRQAVPFTSQFPQTTQIQTGTETVPAQSNALSFTGAPGPIKGAAPIPNAVGPAAREAVVRDQAGNPMIEHTAPDGSKSYRPMPGNGGPAPMVNFPAGESALTKATLESERDVARNVLSQAPILHQTNRGVLEEIDKTAATGTLGPRLQSLMSAAGASLPQGWGGASAEEKASSYDLLGKYLERNALQAAQGMGPHTNAGLESQIKAQGSVAYNPTAIKRITKLNDAIVTGSEMYQPGLEAAIRSSPDQIFAKRQFDQQWAQNFDVRAMQLYNAQKAGDKDEVDTIKRSLGPKGVEDLQRKVRNLQSLATTGRM